MSKILDFVEVATAFMSHAFTARALLLLAFLVSTRACSFFVTDERTNQSSKIEQMDPIKRMHCSLELLQRLDMILVRAGELGKHYGPWQWAEDMILIEELELEYGLGHGMMGEPHRALREGLNNRKNENLRNLWEFNGHTDESDWAAIQNEEAVQWLESETDPLFHENLKWTMAFRALSWKAKAELVGHWLWQAYLRCFAFACVLYLIWLKDLAGHASEKAFWAVKTTSKDEWHDVAEAERQSVVRRIQWLVLKNPVSFALIMIFYPVVIGAFWVIMILDKENEAAAEVRRTKLKLFSLFSENEAALVADFVRRGLTREEIQEELAMMGHQPRHSYAAALLATAAIVTVTAGTTKVHAASPLESGGVVSAVSDYGARDGPELSGNDDDRSGTQPPADFVTQPDFALEWSGQTIAILKQAELAGIARGVDHVPLASLVYQS